MFPGGKYGGLVGAPMKNWDDASGQYGHEWGNMNIRLSDSLSKLRDREISGKVRV